MGLNGELYNIGEITFTAEGRGSVSVTLNPRSEIYKAHFPGMPITPGVCLVQMCVDILSAVHRRKLVLSEARDIRFLVPVLPVENGVLRVEFESSDGDRVVSSLQFFCGEVCHARMKVTLV